MPTLRKMMPPGDTEPADPLADLPPLTSDGVRAWVGDVMLKRGMSYVDSSLFDIRRTGRTLKAHCRGTAAQPYRVEATLALSGGVEDDDCTCPVGHRCKHVAALLMAWQEDPDAFVEVEDVGAALERRDKAELIALIRQMLARYPDLEVLLEMPLPDPGGQPADPALIRHQISSAFRAAGSDWGAAGEVSQRLEPLVEVADGYAHLSDWRNAAVVYRAIIEGITEHYDDVQDENGDLHEIVNDCTSGLGTCLQAEADPAARTQILQVLFDIYRWDITLGGVDIGYEAPDIIQAHASPEERRMVAGWVQERAPAGSEWSRSWGQQQMGGFLLHLLGDQMDDETFLRICRETDRRHDLIDRLLALGRIDQATDELRQAHDSELLSLADLLRERGHAGRAEQVVRERLPAAQWQERYTVWLRERLLERGDTAGGLVLSETLFWQHPGLPRYQEIKRLAEALGTWGALRAEVLRRLTQYRRPELLAEIYLYDGEVAQALEALKHIDPQAGFAYGSGSEALRIRVAMAAEQDFPDQAIEIYTAVAERLIQFQGRENYVAAARYLARTRDLYLRLGQSSAWNRLIADLRARHRRLRALREELDRAGL